MKAKFVQLECSFESLDAVFLVGILAFQCNQVMAEGDIEDQVGAHGHFGIDIGLSQYSFSEAKWISVDKACFVTVVAVVDVLGFVVLVGESLAKAAVHGCLGVLHDGSIDRRLLFSWSSRQAVVEDVQRLAVVSAFHEKGSKVVHFQEGVHDGCVLVVVVSL